MIDINTCIDFFCLVKGVEAWEAVRAPKAKGVDFA